MRGTIKRITGGALAAVLLLPALAAPAPALRKQVWAYDGGVYFKTDGSISNGSCLRISGRITGDFFEHLKRIDDTSGTEFLRGAERVTQFPDKLLLQFVIHDYPCNPQAQSVGSTPFLTRETMRSLRLSFYWKRGLELRPAEGVTQTGFFVERVEPYDKEASASLPERLIWNYQFLVPSAGVPLTDLFVLVLRAPDGCIVARVAARL